MHLATLAGFDFCNVISKPDENNVGAEGCDYYGSMVLYFLEQ